MRPVIFDIDGVLADYCEGFTVLARSALANFNIPLTPTHVRERWDVVPGMTKEMEQTVQDVIRHHPTFWESLETLATETEFQRIEEICGFLPVYFVTGRVGPHVERQTKTWLFRHGIGDPNVIVTHRKGEIAKALDATHMIDDKAGNVVFTQYFSPRTKAFLLDRLYNRFDSSVVGTKVARIATLADYLDAITGDRL